MVVLDSLVMLVGANSGGNADAGSIPNNIISNSGGLENDFSSVVWLNISPYISAAWVVYPPALNCERNDGHGENFMSVSWSASSWSWWTSVFMVVWTTSSANCCLFLSTIIKHLPRFWLSFVSTTSWTPSMLFKCLYTLFDDYSLNAMASSQYLGWWYNLYCCESHYSVSTLMYSFHIHVYRP